MLIRTEKQLEAFGERVAKQIAYSKGHITPRVKGESHKRPVVSHKSGANVVALVGEIGSGKTTFVRGFARGLGVRSHIASPTFILTRRHRIPADRHISRSANQKEKILSNLPISQFAGEPRWLWHLDLYRIHGKSELSDIHFYEMLSEPNNIVVIEWANQIKVAIPKGATWIEFQHHKKGRIVTIQRSKI